MKEKDINKLWKVELRDRINKELKKMNKPELRKILRLAKEWN